MFEILAAVQLRKVIKGEWLLVLGGVLSVLLGASWPFFPNQAQKCSSGWWGLRDPVCILLFAFALRLRSLGNTLKRQLMVMA